MTQRQSWEFPYTADVLLEAATAKVTHHNARLKFWTDKKAEVIASIKSEGIEIDETLSDLTSNSTYARNSTVQVRNDLVRDLQECVERTRAHQTHIAAYAAWTEVLASQGKASFPLNQDDWLFFFSKA